MFLHFMHIARKLSIFFSPIDYHFKSLQRERYFSGKLLKYLQYYNFYTDGSYYMSVRALNNIDFGGPMALTVCHSTPLVIDNTPPILYDIYNITYDSSIYLIGTSISAT